MNRKWMLLAAALLSTAAMAADTTTPYSKQVPVGAQDRVSISNVAGSVDITTWERKEVDIQGELGSGVERVDVTQQEGGVEVRVVMKDSNDGWSGDSWKKGAANLRIRLPATVRLEANTVSASLTTAGVRGKMRLKSVSGDIRSDVVSQDLEVKSVSGDIELNGSGSPSRLRASSVSGDLTLKKIAGEVEAKSVSGDVDVAMQAADDIRVSSVSGDISIQGGLTKEGELEADSVSGRVRAVAQAPSGYHYEAKSFSGRIKTCLAGQVEKSKGSGGSRLDGALGGGGATVRLQSHSGPVEVCDH
jgi:DUF4097 and DUF4098 domain-containing protein YvlB